MKYIVYLILLNSLLLSGDFKREFIIDGFISKDNKTYIDNKEINLLKEKFKNFSVKLHLNKDVINSNTFYAKIICDVNSLVKANVQYEKGLGVIFVKIDKNSPKDMIFQFAYKKEKPLNFRVFTLSQFEYNYILKNEGILYGIAYGIIFTAFLYNLVIFLYTYQKSFLYYSLMQIFLLITLAYITFLTSLTFIEPSQQMFIDFLETLCVLLTILFSKEILNTKKALKSMNKLLNFLIYLNVVDLIAIFIFEISILYEIIPRSVVVSILVIAGLLALIKGQKTAIFYSLGWSVLFISLIFAEYDYLVGLDQLYIIHIGFPLESLILSFALGYKLKQTVEEKKEKEKILVHQSKLASMGEMINNIAHQWRQPLSHLAFINMDIQMAKEDNDLSKKYLFDKLNESNDQIDFMSKTIDNFRDFYKPRKEKEFFSVNEATKKAIDIIKPSLKEANINLEYEVIKDKKIRAYENEYSQVVLNFLSNAKDILLQRDIQNAKISIKLEVIKNKSLLTVEDNAGGIKDDIIEKIFEPYFTTKEKSSGIGLYMSKAIVESHLKGEIKVFNSLKGACFSVEV